MTLCNICKIIFKSSCQFPLPAVVCFAAQTARLAPTIVQDPGLPIRRRSRSQEDYEDMLAKKLKAWHRRRHVGPQTERASQLSRAKTCAGWAPHWLHSHAQPARWINFGSFAKACHGKSYNSGFLLFLEQQLAHKYYMLTKNQERTTLPSTTSDRQRARVKRKNVCKSKAWRDGANLKAHKPQNFVGWQKQY